MNTSRTQPQNQFVTVAKVAEIPDPGSQLVEVDDRLIVLFHAAGHFYAIDDVCTHDGGPLSEGRLEDMSIACPRHGAKFDIRDGAHADHARHAAHRGP